MWRVTDNRMYIYVDLPLLAKNFPNGIASPFSDTPFDLLLIGLIFLFLLSVDPWDLRLRFGRETSTPSDNPLWQSSGIMENGKNLGMRRASRACGGKTIVERNFGLWNWNDTSTVIEHKPNPRSQIQYKALEPVLFLTLFYIVALGSVGLVFLPQMELPSQRRAITPELTKCTT